MIINGFNIYIQRKPIKSINLKAYPNLEIKSSFPENLDILSVKWIIVVLSWSNTIII